MKRLSVKARVQSVTPGYNDSAQVQFYANYSDAQGNRINQEWAEATPVFNMTMVVKAELAGTFEVGDEVTLYIEKED